MTSQTPTQTKANGNEETTYKEQLDKAAQSTRDAENEKPNPVVEKITEYIPAAAKFLPQKSPPREEVKPDGPPERPVHDEKIEDFVRDQHRSKADNILGEVPNDQ